MANLGCYNTYNKEIISQIFISKIAEYKDHISIE